MQIHTCVTVFDSKCVKRVLAVSKLYKTVIIIVLVALVVYNIYNI